MFVRPSFLDLRVEEDHIANDPITNFSREPQRSSPTPRDPSCQSLRPENANTEAATRAPRPPSHSAKTPSRRFHPQLRRIARGCRALSPSPPRGPRIAPGRYSNCPRPAPQTLYRFPRQQSVSIRAASPNSQMCPRQTQNLVRVLPSPLAPRTPPPLSVLLLPRLTIQTSHPARASLGQAHSRRQSAPRSRHDRQNSAHSLSFRAAGGTPSEWSRNLLPQSPVSESPLLS